MFAWKAWSLAIPALCVGLFASSCGNVVFTDIDGELGVSTDASGRLLIHVNTCSVVVDRVGFAGPNIEGVNESFGDWHRKDPVSGTFVFDPTVPPEGWETLEPFDMTEDRDLLVLASAGSARKDTSVGAMSFRLRELDALEPGQILVGDVPGEYQRREREILSEEEFSKCP